MQFLEETRSIQTAGTCHELLGEILMLSVSKEEGKVEMAVVKIGKNPTHL